MTRRARSPIVTVPISLPPALRPRARTYSSMKNATPAVSTIHASPPTIHTAIRYSTSLRRSTAESSTYPHFVVRSVATATAPSRVSPSPLKTISQPARICQRPPWVATTMAASAIQVEVNVSTSGCTPRRANGRATA